MIPGTPPTSFRENPARESVCAPAIDSISRLIPPVISLYPGLEEPRRRQRALFPEIMGPAAASDCGEAFSAHTLRHSSSR
jgi:hypothetical protein